MHGGIKAEAWRCGETPQSTAASLRAAKGRLRTMGPPTQRAPPGTEGPQIAHNVNAMETTL
eukprot:5389876-Pyramimonas_sp.AAC.1